MRDTTFPIAANYPTPLQHPSLRGPKIMELIKDLIRPTKRPFDIIQVEVTSHCAAKCTYCPHTTKADTWEARHMHERTFVNLWPLLKQTTRVHLQGWGEPFLHPHFFDFVALARKAGCLVSSTSCGLHLTDRIIEKILKSGMDIVAFSLAGTDHISNSPRQGADFDKVCQGIKRLQALRKKNLVVHLEIHLAYILLTDRLHAVQKLPKLMQELDIHASIVSTLDYLADTSQAHLAINPHDSEIIDQAQKILKHAADEALKNEQQIYYALPSLNQSVQCRENIQKSLYIDADGDVAPCIYLNVPHFDAKKTTFGNVNSDNILNLWEQKNFRDFRLAHANNTPIEQCQNCVKKFEILQ